MTVTRGQFEQILPYILREETSADPDGWSEDNPYWGHCAVVSALAYTLFGGEILRASLGDTVFASTRTHYANYLSDFCFEDFTQEQFGSDGALDVKDLPWELSSFEYILKDPETGWFRPDTLRRFVLLQERFWRELLRVTAEEQEASQS